MNSIHNFAFHMGLLWSLQILIRKEYLTVRGEPYVGQIAFCRKIGSCSLFSCNGNGFGVRGNCNKKIHNPHWIWNWDIRAKINFFIWNCKKGGTSTYTDLVSLIGNAQCEHFIFRIFLQLRFYVKPILVILMPQILPFRPFEQPSILNFWELLTFSFFKCEIFLKIKIQSLQIC